MPVSTFTEQCIGCKLTSESSAGCQLMEQIAKPCRLEGEQSEKRIAFFKKSLKPKAAIICNYIRCISDPLNAKLLFKKIPISHNTVTSDATGFLYLHCLSDSEMMNV